MFRKHEPMWSGQLTELKIDLVLDGKPFKSARYWAGPKKGEIERAEIKKYLKAGIIQPAMSQMGSASAVCSEEKWEFTFLYRLQEI